MYLNQPSYSLLSFTTSIPNLLFCEIITVVKLTILIKMRIELSKKIE